MSTPFRRFGAIIKAEGFLTNGPVSLTAATTATRALNAGRTNTLNLAAGFTVTLPAASGTGDVYRFVVGTAAASGDYVIKVADSTDVMYGGIFIGDSGDTTPAEADFFTTASTSDTITLDQSAGGGQVGDWVELEDIGTNKWAVRGVFRDMTDPATPFSASV